MFSGITSYIGAVAASIILLAWSIDNLLQKKISRINQILVQANTAKLRHEFETSILHDVADVRDYIHNLEMDRQEKKETPKIRGVPLEFLNVSAGRMRPVYQLTGRMQYFRLAAELLQSTFIEVDLPKNIELEMSKAVKYYQTLNSNLAAKQGDIQDFIQTVVLRKFGGNRPISIEDMPENPYAEPTKQEIETLDRLLDEYFNISKVAEPMLEINQSKLYKAHAAAISFISSRQKVYERASSIISILHIAIFLTGSVLAIIASILASGGK